MNIQEGKKAPDFTLRDENDNLFSLSNLKGKNVVLYFYPKDNTPGCTNEALQFASLYDDFKEINTEIVGISPDSPKSHKKFKEKFKLPFKLLSDETKEVAKSYGVLKEKKLFGKSRLGISRTTFFIDSDGVVKKVWRNVKVRGHGKEVYETVSEELKKEDKNDAHNM